MPYPVGHVTFVYETWNGQRILEPVYIFVSPNIASMTWGPVRCGSSAHVHVALHSSRHIGLPGPFLANDSWDESKVLIEQTGCECALAMSRDQLEVHRLCARLPVDFRPMTVDQ